MERGGKGLPEDSKEAKKLETIISNISLTPEQLKDVIEKLKNPSSKDLSTTLHKFSKKAVTVLMLGDLHMNAYEPISKKKLCDFKRLSEVLRIGKEEGADYVIQTGDVTDGENMRPWQKYSLCVQGFDDVRDFCIDKWPESGLPTYFIGGNHDATYLNIVKADICQAIADKRPDLTYLGMNEANLPLQPALIKMLREGKKVPENATWIRIRHPAKGTAKSQSYQPQAHIEATQSDFKPKILVIGHYHKMDYLFERNIHCFQTGAFEKQSDWMRTKDLVAHLGAWLVTFNYKDDGTIDAVRKRKLLPGINGNERWGKNMSDDKRILQYMELNDKGVYESNKRERK